MVTKDETYSLYLSHKTCIETIEENMHVDIGAFFAATSMTSSTSSVTTTASMKSREEKAADRYERQPLLCERACQLDHF